MFTMNVRNLWLFFVLSAVSFAVQATTIKKDVCLTFNRTGSDVSGVVVNVCDNTGATLDGISARLVSTSFGALKTAGATAITNGSVLAPDSYGNGEGAEISYLFCIEGLPSNFTYNTVEADVFALTAGGGAQRNTGDTQRYFQFQAFTGNTEQVSLFAEKAVDTDICTVSDQKDGLYHSLQTMTAETAATATNPLYLRVTLIKKSSLGCYAGIGMVTLCTTGEEGGEVTNGFTADKFYTIHRNNNTSAYICQSGAQMSTSSLATDKKCWWVLEPTGNEDCYYIKNATTGDYVQSSVQTLSSLVPMGKEPVEFQIKKDITPGASTAGYYYMASTDQNISVATDATLGLNFGATGVVAYYIKTGRGNSYWQIEEDEYRYDPPVVNVTDYARSLQLYSVPCGSLGTAYLTAADIEGADVLSALHYSSEKKPSSPHVLYTAQKAVVRQGGKLPLSVTVANDGNAIQSIAYADWDGDGVFEVTKPISQGEAELSLPDDVKVGQYRLRIRVTETGTDGAEDDVIGVCYDFIVCVVSAETPITWSVEVNDESRGSAKATEENGVLKLEAEAKGNATFVGWKRMDSYFTGTLVGTETVMEIPLTQSLRLVALFSPNTLEIADNIERLSEGDNEQDSNRTSLSGKRFDLSGRQVPETTKGIVIVNGKKHVITQ